jgi:hypothetical protein
VITVNSIAPQYLEKAAIAEFAAKLRAQGYHVEIEKSWDSFTPDLMASRDGECCTVYQFKSGPWPQEKTEEVLRLRRHVVHNHGGKFKLVWVPPYRKINLQIGKLEHLLAEAIRKDLGPLDELSAHILVDDVSEIQINSLRIDADGVSVEGEGTVFVELDHGSETDRDSGSGASSEEPFPFKFAIKVNSELQPLGKSEISIDTSSFHKGAA